jgi:hypothetical protein
VDWTAIGTIIAGLTLVGSGIGAFLHHRAARRAQEPKIVFGDLHFAGPGEHSRDGYRYAIGVRLTNVGGGPALHVIWGYLDEEHETRKLYAEMVTRAALVPGESTDDWAGIRGERQDDEPTEADARAFYNRCLVFAECWDSRGEHYVFFPFGGGRASDPHGGPVALREHLSQFPSRGEMMRSLGMGEGTRRRDP